MIGGLREGEGTGVKGLTWGGARTGGRKDRRGRRDGTARRACGGGMSWTRLRTTSPSLNLIRIGGEKAGSVVVVVDTCTASLTGDLGLHIWTPTPTRTAMKRTLSTTTTTTTRSGRLAGGTGTGRPRGCL